MTDRIEINPSILQGKPVIHYTRIPVGLLLRKLSEGATIVESRLPNLCSRFDSAGKRLHF